MPRRKNPKPSADGWATVTSGPSPRPPGIDPLNTLNPSATDEPQASTKTFEKVFAEYKQIRSTLQMSANYKKAISFAEMVLLPNLVISPTYKEPRIISVAESGKDFEYREPEMVSPTRGKIDKCICLGLGSLSSDLDNTNSMYQLVLLEGLLKVFGWNTDGQYISCSILTSGYKLIALFR